MKNRIPVAVEREGVLLKSVILRETRGTGEHAVRAPIFVDCTYEGDLAALTNVPYRIARKRGPNSMSPTRASSSCIP